MIRIGTNTGRRRLFGHAGLVAMLLLTACGGSSVSDPRTIAPTARLSGPRPAAPKLAFPAAPAQAAPKPAIPSAASALDREVQRIGTAFHGNVGIAVRDVETGWTSHYRGLDYFPQQSVSKLWVALSVLDRVDEGQLHLGSEIMVRPEDLTLFHQPLRTMVLRTRGFRTTTEDLLTRALTQSDNTANDRLLTEVGGPDFVRATLARKGISGVRFGPGERLLQSRTAGLVWQPRYAIGGAFYAAREALPDAARRQAFNAYVADPIDGATAFGIADALARLSVGQLLSSGSTARFTHIMGQSRTGALRLKSGLRPGWHLAHKTGTGQVFDGEQAGYNDVGILTSPGGRTYTVAVLIGRTADSQADRTALMQKVVAATAGYDAAYAAQQSAAAD